MKSKNNIHQTKNLKYIFILAGFFTLILFFQNCGQKSFQTKNSAAIEYASENVNNSSNLPNENFIDDEEMNSLIDFPESAESSDDTKVIAPMASTSSTGKIYYVSTNGNNANSGTISRPFRSVEFAVNKMLPGDTTYVRSGLYNETNIAFVKSGTQSAPIKLLNYPGEVAIIDFGVNFTNRLVHRITIDAPGENTPIGWITIEGLEIRHGYEGIKYNSAHNITIRRNRIHDNINSAILASSGKNILIDRNSFYNNGPRDLARVHGLYMTGSNYVITNNLIYNSGCYGIQVAGYPWDMKEYFEDPQDYKRGPDASYAGAANWLIANNTFAYNGCSGIVLWRSLTDNSRIYNNIFYENSVKSKVGAEGVNGINFVATGGQAGHKINNNIFYASGSGGMRTFGINGKVGVNYTQSANLIINPNFVSAPASLPISPNFALKANSPAIDRGIASTATKIDYKGTTRPKGGAYDIGALEFVP